MTKEQKLQEKDKVPDDDAKSHSSASTVKKGGKNLDKSISSESRQSHRINTPSERVQDNGLIGEKIDPNYDSPNTKIPKTES